MIPMLIGNSGRPLHAVFSPAVGKRRRRAVVFCPPFGAEYARTHRAGRMLAQKLAAAGYDILRFDYYGTGDSSGEDHEFSPEGAVEDTLAAVDEAKDLSSARRVMLVGMRDGAAVALRVAARSGGVDRLVLWEPVVPDEVLDGEIPAAATLILVSGEASQHHRLRDQLGRVTPRVTLEEHPSRAPWVPHGEDGVGVAPVAAMNRIAGWEP
jgi:pimeloyl-ACP methyl ester carboxylesterase